jgi:hypothetical protein
VLGGEVSFGFPHFIRKLHIQGVNGVDQRALCLRFIVYAARLNDVLRSSPKGKIEKTVG